MRSKLFTVFFIIGIGCFSLIPANEITNYQILQKIADYRNNELAWPILHYAIKMGDKLLVQALLEGGVDVNCRTKFAFVRLSPSSQSYKNDGYTPIEIAIEQRNAEIVSILLDYGADPYPMRCVNLDVKNNGLTGNFSSIFAAIQLNDYQTIEALVAHKVDFNRICRTEQDKQPLSGYDAAFLFGNAKVIAIILGIRHP